MQQFYRSILSVLIISQMNTHVLSQNRTNLGKEYWLGFSTSMLDTGSNVQKGVLYIGGSSQNAIVTVSIDSSGVIPATWYKKVYNIPANSFVTAEPIPSGPKGSNPNFDARFGGEDTFRQ